MQIEPTNRRTFLRHAATVGGLAAVGGSLTTLLAACGSKSNSSSSTSKSSSTSSTAAFDASILTFDHVSGQNMRVSFGLVDPGGELVSSDERVRVQFGPDKGQMTSDEMIFTGHAGESDHDIALSDHEHLPYFSGTFQFPENAKTYPTPNLWWAQVSWASIVADVPIQVYDPTDVPFPGVGKKLISIPTPTVANALNVKPICTRSSACPFHAQSLDAAIAAGKPIVLMFATPARCVSRFCGPTLDNVIAASTEFTDRVTFIHCEIFESDETDSYAPGVLTYAIPGEPMMFVANAQGIITTHVSGAIEPSDVRAAILTAL